MGSLLVVIDMQNDFITGTLGTAQAREILQKVVEKIKKHKGDVLFTRDTHEEDYLTTQEGQKLPVAHCIKGTDGWQLESNIRELAENGGYRVFDKPSFGSLALAEYIQKEMARADWEEIELVGLCTDICVISNAMIIKAAVPETKLLVDGSCCAGVTPESHKNALDVMKVCQIDIIGYGRG